MVLFKTNSKSFIKTIATGFFVYFSLFQIIAMPLKVFLQPLSALSVSWTVVVLLTVVMAVIFRNKLDFYGFIKDTLAIISDNKKVYIVLFLIVLVQCIILMFNARYGSMMDFSYYMGETTSSLQTNTICQFDPYHGVKLRYLQTSSLFENIGVHSAVVSQITGLHPLIEFNTCTRFIAIILADLILFKIALTLFDNEHVKSATMFGFVILIEFCYVSFYSPSSFLYNRTAEGKTFAAVIVLPMVFLLFLELLKNAEVKGMWSTLFIIMLGATCVNMTALFLAPVLAFCMLLPGIIINKKLSWMLNYIICMIPSVIMIGYYYLYNKGFMLVYT